MVIKLGVSSNGLFEPRGGPVVWVVIRSADRKWTSMSQFWSEQELEPLRTAHRDEISQGVGNASLAERKSSEFSEGWVEATANSR